MSSILRGLMCIRTNGSFAPTQKQVALNQKMNPRASSTLAFNQKQMVSDETMRKLELESQINELRAKFLSEVAKTKYNTYETRIGMLEDQLLIARRVTVIEKDSLWKNLLFGALTFGSLGMTFGVAAAQAKPLEPSDKGSNVQIKV